jgi:hypothetical protein
MPGAFFIAASSWRIRPADPCPGALKANLIVRQAKRILFQIDGEEAGLMDPRPVPDRNRYGVDIRRTRYVMTRRTPVRLFRSAGCGVAVAPPGRR